MATRVRNPPARTLRVPPPVPPQQPGILARNAPGAILTGMVAITPLCLLSGIFLSHDVILKLVAALFGAASLLLLWPRWSRKLPALWADRRARWFLSLAAAQIASLILSTVLSTHPALSFAGTVWRRFGADRKNCPCQ